MKDFIEKWKSDTKFSAKIKLGLYTLFVVVVSIYTIAGSRNINATSNNNTQKDIYNYQININSNDNLYHYFGTKNKNEITINKKTNDQVVGYAYKDNNYYKYENNIYVLTSEEEIYDVIEFNFLSLDTINKYLSLSTLIDGKNIVYLKDIIIGNGSEEYITIEKTSNKYIVDYTQLMKLFDDSIVKLTVEIIIE